MTAALPDLSLDQIFRSARTFNGWTDRPVDDATVREIYDLMKWGPTSANCSPARFVWGRSADGKATLAGLAADPNKAKILQAPVTVIIGHDLDFAAELPKLMPHAASPAGPHRPGHRWPPHPARPRLEPATPQRCRDRRWRPAPARRRAGAAGSGGRAGRRRTSARPPRPTPTTTEGWQTCSPGNTRKQQANTTPAGGIGGSRHPVRHRL